MYQHTYNKKNVEQKIKYGLRSLKKRWYIVLAYFTFKIAACVA